LRFKSSSLGQCKRSAATADIDPVDVGISISCTALGSGLYNYWRMLKLEPHIRIFHAPRRARALDLGGRARAAAHRQIVLTVHIKCKAIRSPERIVVFAKL
jgi:hypothetical protein